LARAPHIQLMTSNYHVQADWDAKAGVWVSSTNIPGLVVEAATLPEFVELVEALAPELLADNAGLHGKIRIELRANGALELAVA
jgi:hypothetical protein